MEESKDLEHLMEPYIYSRDREEFSLGDTLDIKTGLVLASLTFLAIQTGGLIQSHLTDVGWFAQHVSVLALIAGGFLSIWELWPRDYDREPLPSAYEAWFGQLQEYYAANPQLTDTPVRQAMAGRLQRAKERIGTNIEINKGKSKLLYASFVCVAVSFTANIITVAIRLF